MKTSHVGTKKEEKKGQSQLNRSVEIKNLTTKNFYEVPSLPDKSHLVHTSLNLNVKGYKPLTFRPNVCLYFIHSIKCQKVVKESPNELKEKNVQLNKWQKPLCGP